MPPPSAGGLWPLEWRAVFARWIDGGHRRLSLGTGQNYKLAPAAGHTHQLSCTVAVPNIRDAAAWLDVVDANPASTTYRLYVFGGETVPPPADTKNLSLRERVDTAAAPNGVTVIDAAGSRHLTEPVA